jgi:hypothetical protein
LELQLRQSLFKGANAPAFVRVQIFNRFDVTFVIQRANVAVLNKFTMLVFVQPAEWQSLRAADVRAISVDSTRALIIQERASAGRMGYRRFQKWRVLVADVCCFNFEDRQIVNAAHAASAPADQPRAMNLRKHTRLGIDIPIERLQIRQWLLRS